MNYSGVYIYIYIYNFFKYPVRWQKLFGSARSGNTALSYRNCVIPLIGGWWGQGVARAFTRCMMKKYIYHHHYQVDQKITPHSLSFSLSLSLSPVIGSNHLSLLEGLLDCTLCPHRADVCKLLLIDKHSRFAVWERMLLMSSSFLLQQYLECLVLLISCFVGYCFNDSFKTASNILV